MYLQLLMGAMAALLIAVQAFAGGTPLDPFIKSVAKRSGVSEEAVRAETIDVLRRSGRFSADEVNRIRGQESVDLSPVRTGEMVRLLQRSRRFRWRTGLEAVRIRQIGWKAAEEFDRIARREAAHVFKQRGLEFEIAQTGLEATRLTVEALRARRVAAERLRAAVLSHRQSEDGLEAARIRRLDAAVDVLEIHDIDYAVVGDGAAVIQQAAETIGEK